MFKILKTVGKWLKNIWESDIIEVPKKRDWDFSYIKDCSAKEIYTGIVAGVLIIPTMIIKVLILLAYVLWMVGTGILELILRLFRKTK